MPEHTRQAGVHFEDPLTMFHLFSLAYLLCSKSQKKFDQATIWLEQITKLPLKPIDFCKFINMALIQQVCCEWSHLQDNNCKQIFSTSDSTSCSLMDTRSWLILRKACTALSLSSFSDSRSFVRTATCE